MGGFAMLLKQQPFYSALTSRYPGLVERVRKIIEDSERKFSASGPRTGKTAPQSEGSFLWEHTVLVTSLAFRLAQAEKEDAGLAAVAALFHDAGKFSGGRYHRGSRPEEESAARKAREVLEDVGMEMASLGHVVRALRSLYNAGARRNRLADIVHDADFLSKFGLLGVANFFVKSTLRGRTLEAALVDFLSKELSYATVLPANMRTEAARKMARKKSAETLRFYRAFLAELKESHGLDFRVRTYTVERPGRAGRKASVSLVLPAACDSCGGRWEVELRTESGLKCETLESDVRCADCGARRTVSFCLPELA